MRCRKVPGLRSRTRSSDHRRYEYFVEGALPELRVVAEEDAFIKTADQLLYVVCSLLKGEENLQTERLRKLMA